MHDPATNKLVLRRHAIYTRSQGKPESVEVSTRAQMTEIIESAATYRLRAFVEQADRAGLSLSASSDAPSPAKADADYFDQQHRGVRVTETSSDVVAQIRSAGYWDVTIHPARRVAVALAPSQLLPTLAQNAVSMRGWPVPSIDPRNEPRYTPESVRQDIDATMVDHLEAWQFTTHYQFSQLRSVSADWRPRREKVPVPAGASAVIEVWEILFYLTELIELAARLALASRAPRFVISTSLHNMRRRALVAGTPSREWHGLRLSSSDDLTANVELASEELAARPREVAVELSTSMMAWFGFHPVDGVLRNYQQELTSRS